MRFDKRQSGLIDSEYVWMDIEGWMGTRLSVGETRVGGEDKS